MQNKTVLIIDDDADIRYTIRHICNSQNWNALEAADSREAMEILRQNSPSVILVDYHLPQMDGISIVRQIRKNNRAVSIIVLTIEEKQAVVDKFFEAGVDDYALKPIKALDLIARIKMHFKFNEQRSFYTNRSKGINEKTLRMLVEFLQNRREFASLEEIEKAMPVNSKTLYRYLQYLQENDLLEIKNEYGRVGRPKTYYKLK